MTVAEAIDSFLFHCQYEKNLSPKTLKAYATDLSQFSGHLAAGSVGAVAEVEKEIIREYIQTLYSRLSEKSIKRKVASLKAFFQYLEADDVILVSPFRKLQIRIRESRRLPRTVQLADIRILFQHLYRTAHADAAASSAGAWLLVRDIAVFETLFATGARVSEVCGLLNEDVDLEAGAVRIMGKGSRERIVQICDAETLTALRRYRSLRADRATESRGFFINSRGNRMSEQSVRCALRKHVDAAGLGGRWTPHLFRHSLATLLLLEGVDLRHIQHLLGHSSIATTQIYTHVDSQTQREVLRTRHPRRHLHAQLEKDSAVHGLA